MSVWQLFSSSSLATHFSRTESFPSALVSQRAFKQHQNMCTICSLKGAGQIWKISESSEIKNRNTYCLSWIPYTKWGLRTKTFAVLKLNTIELPFVLSSYPPTVPSSILRHIWNLRQWYFNTIESVFYLTLSPHLLLQIHFSLTMNKLLSSKLVLFTFHF